MRFDLVQLSTVTRRRGRVLGVNHTPSYAAGPQSPNFLRPTCADTIWHTANTFFHDDDKCKILPDRSCPQPGYFCSTNAGEWFVCGS